MLFLYIFIPVFLFNYVISNMINSRKIQKRNKIIAQGLVSFYFYKSSCFDGYIRKNIKEKQKKTEFLLLSSCFIDKNFTENCSNTKKLLTEYKKKRFIICFSDRMKYLAEIE